MAIKDINKTVDAIQLNPDNVILRFNCSECWAMEIEEVSLSSLLISGNPICTDCDSEKLYVETILKGE
jgi:hypothetical protein